LIGWGYACTAATAALKIGGSNHLLLSEMMPSCTDRAPVRAVGKSRHAVQANFYVVLFLGPKT
ncbi:hypothetical protein L2249_11440, partial [Xanthomonas perforans]|uniref:hypothetical protein n=1 Tax=Xanthomonas perforans TaxID=442694 RepID=UPI001F3188F5